jgi:uncharacterized protein YjiS (DUF1127 family)
MLIRFFIRIGEALARRRRTQLAVQRLSTLNDRMLKDIGISRSQIEAVINER